MRRLSIPALILALLIIAVFFRWDTEAQKTLDGAVIKWERDRWTQEVHRFVYVVSAKDDGGQYDRSQESIRNNSASATGIWFYGVLGSGIWLFIAARRNRKNKKEEVGKCKQASSSPPSSSGPA